MGVEIDISKKLDEIGEDVVGDSIFAEGDVIISVLHVGIMILICADNEDLRESQLNRTVCLKTLNRDNLGNCILNSEAFR